MRARAREEFISVLKRLVSLLPRMSDEDKDRVFKFVNLAEDGDRTLKQVYEAEALLSKYDPQFALEKKGERIEARLVAIDNAKKLRKGLAQLQITEKHIAQERAEFAKRVEVLQKNKRLGYRLKEARVPINQWWHI
jgi:hypothetical protein